jgi:Zn ribbon nucleic-acid-binding protein
MEYPNWENKKQMKVSVSLPTDEHGFLGRECPNCHRYFKIKIGTGLNPSAFACPYCSFQGTRKDFHTKEQVEYARSVAKQKFIDNVIEPMLRDFETQLKSFETHSGFLQIRVESNRSPIIVPLSLYQEKAVETAVKCDHCGLEFEIYGVFANCPDCRALNALMVFKKSVEVSQKRLGLMQSVENDPTMQNALLEDALSGGVSSFDAFGKALQAHYPKSFPDKPRNLFQNLDALSKCLMESFGKSLSDIIGDETFALLLRMFQVRHLFEHNMGVVDDDFIRKVPDLLGLKGRKYPLKREEIELFLNALLEAGNQILINSEKGTKTKD